MKLDDFQSGALDQRTFLDSFLDISRAYLQSSERISALNMAAIRETVNDAAALAGSLAGATSVEEVQEIASAMDVSLIDRALAYSLDVQQAATNAQLEVCNLLQQNLQNPLGMGAPLAR